MTPYRTPDQYTPCHYTTNRALLRNPEVNVTFDQVLRMSDAAFVAWMERVRRAILTQWDTQNVPPRVGLSDHEIDVAWDRMRAADIPSLWMTCDDGVVGITAPATSHAVVNQWFPTMMKTRINYSDKDVGISIYDMFSRDEIWSRYCQSYAARHFRRDSFYAYSRAIHTHEGVASQPSIVPTSAYEYLTVLAETEQMSGGFDVFDGGESSPEYGVWLAPAVNDEEYSGYSNHLKDRRIWTCTHEEAVAWRDSGRFPAHWFHMVGPSLRKKTHYMLRLYRTDARIFPDGFKSFRVSMCQYAVNFPALIARALYERFTDGIAEPIIYDPSAGWAGRLVGAITARRHGTYIACDPNTDHLWTDEQGVAHSKYTEIAAYHASRLAFDQRKPNVVFFPCGSEEMRQHAAFQEYRGKIDVAFTSPPYFNREAYSDDPAQSYKKFHAFEDWCEGFLKPTIETAAEWLRPGGYLLWNIADIKHGKAYLPLEARSCAYATAAGLVQGETIRMVLASMPGANRVSDDGQGTAKNTCMVSGRVTKYEPVLIFQKPL